MSGKVSEVEETAGGMDVPEIIRAAGDNAVREYREFLDDPKRSPSTRKQYRGAIGRFMHWAERRGAVLETINVADLTAYSTAIASRSSQHTAGVSLTGVRGLLNHLFRAGVLAENPLINFGSDLRQPVEQEIPDPSVTASSAGDGKPFGMSSTSRPTTIDSEAGDTETRCPDVASPGFPLLDLLAMLGNMEEETLGRIFDYDAVALLLLERVRWPDGQACPHCGAGAGDDPPAQAVCQACAKQYTATTGTMFEGSTVPLRHWFFLMHQLYLTEEGLSDEGLRQSDLEYRAVLSVCRDIGEVFGREALPSGEGLKRAIAVRNKELIQDDVGRAIIKYAELEAVKDRLVLARDEGTSIDDLPEGMTLETAIKKIEALIAEEDSYVIIKEDGYLMRRLATPDEVAGSAGGDMPMA